MRCCVFLFVALSLAAQDPGEILRRAIEALPSHVERQSQFLYREEIRGYELDPMGRKNRTSWQTYEALIVEGEIYYLRVAVDGRELAPELKKSEEEALEREAAMRRRVPLAERWRLRQNQSQERYVARLADMAEFHALELRGAAEVHGRPVWVVEGLPRDSNIRAKQKFEMLRVSRCKLWIDQQNYAVLRREVEVLRPWMDYGAGSTSTMDTVLVGEAVLPAVLQQTIQPKSAQGQALLREQVYSNYRRFSVEVSQQEQKQEQN
jgi:hypothetical protein